MNDPERHEFTVEYIAEMLKTRKEIAKQIGRPTETVLFLGSRTCSLFRHPFLADQLEKFSYRDFSNMTAIEQFHECYDTLEKLKHKKQDSDIRGIIATALEKKRIEVADLCVAELMKDQHFDYIITTNIGNELELAFQKRDMKMPRDFEVIIPGEGKMTEGRGKMIKASGDVVARRFCIGKYNMGSKKIPDLTTPLRWIREKAMLMVGFDYKWDEHILQAIFPHIDGPLWYVNEEKTAEESSLFTYLDTYEAERIEDTTGGYDLFFTNLCFHTLGFVPSVPTDPSKDHTKRSAQHDLQDEMSHLTEIVNKLLESHEAMKLDIKADIKNLSEKVDTLFKHSRLYSDSTSIPSEEN